MTSNVVFRSLLACLLLCFVAAQQLPFSVPNTIGPFLRFSRRQGNNVYFSALVGVKGGSPSSIAKCLSLKAKPDKGNAKVTKVDKTLLTTTNGYTFIRWKIAVTLGSKEQSISYAVSSNCSSVVLEPEVKSSYNFYVAGAKQSWNWVYYSCNGFHDPANAPATGVKPLWDDLMAQHASKKIHLIAGNGDQLYSDGITRATPEIAAAFGADDKDATLSFKWTASLSKAVDDWYFSAYANHWTLVSDSYRKALASIPFTMTWDDHDILNGYGSLLPAVQQSDLIQGLGAAATKFYFLFQQHSTPTNMMDDFTWSKKLKAKHVVSLLGPTTVLVAPDLRSERTREQVLTKASYSAIMKQLNTMPKTVKHVVVLTASPLIYPITTYYSDKILEPYEVDGKRPKWSQLQDKLETTFLGNFFLKTLLSFLDGGKEWGTLKFSDLIDQWDSNQHYNERQYLVFKMQGWAKLRGARASFIGGDSHLALAGEFSSVKNLPPSKDPNYSVAVVSSGIGNVPFKAGAEILETICEDYVGYLDQAQAVKATVKPLFKGVGRLLDFNEYAAPLRNYLQVREVSQTGDLQLTWRLEDETPGVIDTRSLIVPLYKP